MKMNRKIIATLALGALLGVKAANAQSPEVDVNALLQRIQELEQKVKVIERKGELDKRPSLPEKAKSSPTVSIGATGLQASSADTNFTFALRGCCQVDTRTFVDDGGIQGNDAFLVRRARPIFPARSFGILISCSTRFCRSTVQIFDAYLNYRYQPWLQVGGQIQIAGWAGISPVGSVHLVQ